MIYAYYFGILFFFPSPSPVLNVTSFIPEDLLLLLQAPHFPAFFFSGVLLLLLIALTVITYRIWRNWQADQRQVIKQEQHIHQLQAQHKELERQLELQHFLFSGLKHILSEVLERHVQHAATLQDESTSAGQKRESQRSLQENQQLLKLFMEDAPKLSKPEDPQFHVQEETIDLNQLLHELHSFVLREKEEQKRPQLNIYFDGPDQREAFYIQSDRQRIMQIFSILIRHSIRYTHHGKITISYQVLKNALLFTIEDTGLGFTPSEYSGLFHFFFFYGNMLSHTPAERQLELILAGEIIHHMKGEIQAESREQGGTKFIVKLPFSPLPETGNAGESNQAGEQTTQYDWTDKTILVVEDSRMAYELIKKMFSHSGAIFALEPDGIKAVGRCKNDDTIDLVLMDIQLPLMDGYKATLEIKKIRPGLTVIAQTANALAGDRKKAREAGCDEYIAKPIDIDEMGEKINQFINHRP